MSRPSYILATVLFCAFSLQAAERRGPLVHTVKKGDTLSGIAKDYRVSLAQIYRWNNLRNEHIRGGQHLNIWLPAQKNDWYRVRPGDNLSQIATRFYIPVRLLKNLNKLNNDTIRPGQKLRLHAEEDPATPKKKNTQTTQKAHTVRLGENLSQIAATYRLTLAQLKNLNKLKGNIIQPGQKLILKTQTRPATKAHHQDARPARTTNSNPPPTSPEEPREYTVRPGDSLDRIARQNGVRLRDLMRWNKLDKTLIRPGQKLVLWKLQPRRPAPTISGGKGRKIYTVHPGDTLWDLARRFKISVNDLKTWNGLNNAIIKPGQQLAIVDKSVYTVVLGDTLYSIARKFGREPNEIARQNNMSLSSTLLAGTTLQIPK